jgi:hypothetical protein
MRGPARSRDEHREVIDGRARPRAQAVKHWLEVAQSCDCTSVDACGLFVDPTLLPPAGDIDLDVRQIGPRGRG